MKINLPPSIRNDDLIAKCAPRGWDNGGSVVWSGYFARGQVLVYGRLPAPSSRQARAICTAYEMEHWSSRKNFRRTIDDIVVTNLFCGYGNGWDIVVCGAIVQHEDHKTSAQREAEKLLDGAM